MKIEHNGRLLELVKENENHKLLRIVNWITVADVPLESTDRWVLCHIGLYYVSGNNDSSEDGIYELHMGHQIHEWTFNKVA